MARPPKYKNKEELQKKVDDYFNQEEVKITITGLCLYLGFDSRQSFYNYEKDKEFLDTIKKARTRVEQYYEEHLLDRSAAGAIFALKNFKWTDRQELDHTSSDGSMSHPNIIVNSEKAGKEIDKLIKDE